MAGILPDAPNTGKFKNIKIDKAARKAVSKAVAKQWARGKIRTYMCTARPTIQWQKCA
jgi:hypothetical protein